MDKARVPRTAGSLLLFEGCESALSSRKMRSIYPGPCSASKDPGSPSASGMTSLLRRTLIQPAFKEGCYVARHDVRLQV